MDYKSKYQDALAWAKELRDKNVEFTIDELEHVFPELNETSEESLKSLCISELNKDLNIANDQYEKSNGRVGGLRVKAIEWGLKKLTSLKEKPSQKYATSNRKFFNFIYERLVHVHNENPYCEYMQSLRKRIDDLFPIEND